MLLALAAAPQVQAQALRGVNLSGAEFGPEKLPGRPGHDYVYPTDAQFEWAAAMRFTVIRLPILWERLQPGLFRPLDPPELARLQAAVAAADQRGIATIIDVHNYGGYRGHMIGSPETPLSAFTDLWRRLAEAFRKDPHAIFGLMNEPKDFAPETWLPVAQAAVTVIRQTGARNLVLVPGAGWDGAHDFTTGHGTGPSNAEALAALHDPASQLAFEVHQYLDADYSGTHPDCPAAPRAAGLLEPFTAWLRAGHRRGFLGEFAVSNRPECLIGLTRMLDHMVANSDVWAGWTAWGGGAWWHADYPFIIEPRDGTEAPQTAVLRNRGSR